jgi:hypothetical protein
MDSVGEVWTRTLRVFGSTSQASFVPEAKYFVELQRHLFLGIALAQNLYRQVGTDGRDRAFGAFASGKTVAREEGDVGRADLRGCAHHAGLSGQNAQVARQDKISQVNGDFESGLPERGLEDPRLRPITQRAMANPRMIRSGFCLRLKAV